VARFRQNLVAALTRLYPFYSGCGKLANSKAMKTLAGNCTTDDLQWAPLGRGVRLRVPMNDFVGRAIFYFGDLDPKITWLCDRIIRPGDTVLDVGANLGWITARMARKVGPTGQVHAFEPNPRVADLLAQSVATSQLRNVHLHRIALGDKSGQLDLHVTRTNAGMASLVYGHNSTTPIYPADSTDVIKVPVRTLTEIFANDPQPPTRIRLVKLDVEGYEPQVLTGAASFFKQINLPDAILFELNELRTAFPDNPAVKILQDLGYTFFTIPKTLFRPRLKRADRADAQGSNDFLAIPNDHRLREIAPLVKAPR
jgi:FkbM family methyltransferase